MKIDQDTRLIARLHTQANGTGLNIYNPYFEDQGINAVYMLFTNATPGPLVDGMKSLDVAGAITAGFEHCDELPGLVDKLSPAAKLVGRIGIITNRNGKLVAHYQGGEGLLAAVQEKTNLTGKDIVLVGAGTVAKTFLFALQQNAEVPRSVTVLNRSLENVARLKTAMPIITKVGGLADLSAVDGDVLINASRIGSSTEDIYFTGDIVSRFNSIADVTFGVENSHLIELARANKYITIATGWDMFTHQAAIVLREILDHEADIDRLRHFVRLGLSNNNHGAHPGKV